MVNKVAAAQKKMEMRKSGDDADSDLDQDPRRRLGTTAENQPGAECQKFEAVD